MVSAANDRHRKDAPSSSGDAANSRTDFTCRIAAIVSVCHEKPERESEMRNYKRESTEADYANECVRAEEDVSERRQQEEEEEGKVVGIRKQVGEMKFEA